MFEGRPVAGWDISYVSHGTGRLRFKTAARLNKAGLLFLLLLVARRFAASAVEGGCRNGGCQVTRTIANLENPNPCGWEMLVTHMSHWGSLI